MREKSFSLFTLKNDSDGNVFKALFVGEEERAKGGGGSRKEGERRKEGKGRERRKEGKGRERKKEGKEKGPGGGGRETQSGFPVNPPLLLLTTYANEYKL